jgi:glutathione peroxidase
MRLILIAIGAVVLLTGLILFILYRDTMAGGVKTPTQKVDGRLWDYSVRTLEGAPASLSDYQGQVALVVNVASKCGLTPQYKGLEALYRSRNDQGFVILAFPSNDFMGQEPGTAEEIRFFCTENYDVTFPMFEKMKVKGEGKSEIYEFLTAGGLEDPSWNFTKFLVGKDGQVIARYAPKTAPDDAELTAAIDQALAGPGQ